MVASLSRLSKEDLAHLARNGAGLELDASLFSVEDLAHVIRNSSGGPIVLRNLVRLTVENLAHLARNSGGRLLLKD